MTDQTTLLKGLSTDVLKRRLENEQLFLDGLLRRRHLVNDILADPERFKEALEQSIQGCETTIAKQKLILMQRP